MNKTMIQNISAGLLLMTSAPLMASDDLPFRLNGFATVGGVLTNNDTVAFEGATKNADFGVDSIIGIQASKSFGDYLDATWQLIIDQDFEGTDIDTEWAFLTVHATDELDVRAGRMRIPFFMISDSLEVGYTYPWIRPPVEVYGQLAFTQFDGADLLYSTSIGDYDISVQPLFGKTSPKVPFFGETPKLDITDLWSVNLIVSGEYVSFRVGQTEGDFDILGSTALNGFAGFLQAPPAMGGLGAPAGVISQLSGTGKHGRFTGVGMTLDMDDLLVMAEYTLRNSDGVISDTAGWYVTTGYRFGDFMPHVTFSSLETKDDFGAAATFAGTIPPGGPVNPATGFTAQQSYLGFLASLPSDQKSVTVGVRWDFAPGMVLKAEIQEIETGTGPFGPNSGLLLDPASGRPIPGFDDSVDVYSLAIDAVF